MSFSVSESLREVREEIARLRKVEDALVAAMGGTDLDGAARNVRTSSWGSKKIQAANRLAWARRKKAPKPEIERLEQELAEVEKHFQEDRKARRASRLAIR